MLTAGAGPMTDGVEPEPTVMIPKGKKFVSTKIEDLTEIELRNVEADLESGINWSECIYKNDDAETRRKLADVFTPNELEGILGDIKGGKP